MVRCLHRTPNYGNFQSSQVLSRNGNLPVSSSSSLIRHNATPRSGRWSPVSPPALCRWPPLPRAPVANQVPVSLSVMAAARRGGAGRGSREGSGRSILAARASLRSGAVAAFPPSPATVRDPTPQATQAMCRGGRLASAKRAELARRPTPGGGAQDAASAKGAGTRAAARASQRSAGGG
jgi:hypothetical protein